MGLQTEDLTGRADWWCEALGSTKQRAVRHRRDFQERFQGDGAAQANVCRLIDDTHTASRQFLSRTRSVRPLNSKGVLPLDAHVTDTRKPKSTRATTPGHQANTVRPARKTQHMWQLSPIHQQRIRRLWSAGRQNRRL